MSALASEVQFLVLFVIIIRRKLVNRTCDADPTDVLTIRISIITIRYTSSFLSYTSSLLRYKSYYTLYALFYLLYTIRLILLSIEQHLIPCASFHFHWATTPLIPNYEQLTYCTLYSVHLSPFELRLISFELNFLAIELLFFFIEFHLIPITVTRYSFLATPWVHIPWVHIPCDPRLNPVELLLIQTNLARIPVDLNLIPVELLLIQTELALISVELKLISVECAPHSYLAGPLFLLSCSSSILSWPFIPVQLKLMPVELLLTSSILSWPLFLLS